MGQPQDNLYQVGSPLLALAFALIWWIPTNHGSQFLLFLHFTLTLCFYDTLMTMVVTLPSR